MTEKKKPISVDLFLRDKPARILLGLKIKEGSIYATMLSKDADCTYSHTIKILNVFRDLGLVKFEKKGRIKKIKLTEDGQEIAHKMEAVFKKLLHMKPKKPEGKKGKK